MVLEIPPKAQCLGLTLIKLDDFQTLNIGTGCKNWDYDNNVNKTHVHSISSYSVERYRQLVHTFPLSHCSI